MKLVYTHDNMLIVENVRNCLLQEGIEPELRNEFAASGMGELSPMETWPELWVDFGWYDKAKAIVDTLVTASDGPVWRCGSCNEENESTFHHCWQCQAPIPADRPVDHRVVD